MANFIADWNAAAAIWGDRMWAVVWQSTLFIAVVALVTALLLRRTSPNVRCWVWQIVALKLLIMPFWTYAILFTQMIPAMPGHELADDDGQKATALKQHSASPSRETTADESNAQAAGDAPQIPAEIRNIPQAVAPWPRITWQGWLLCLWVVVVAAQMVRIAWQHRRLARLLGAAAPAETTLSGLVGEMAGRLGLRRAPLTLMTDVDCSPFVCGVRRPVLVLPLRLTATLSAMELNQVLLHELAHVRRLDLVWGWIGEIARIAYFFHPAVYLVANQIRLERELACDQLAMATSGEGAAEYAATLVRVVSQSSEPSVFKTSAASAGMNGESP